MALMAPMNIIKQQTINERGMIMEKKRLTHNHGKLFGSSASINIIVDEEKIQPFMYGTILLCSIHFILETHACHSNTPIMMKMWTISPHIVEHNPTPRQPSR